MRKKLTCQTVAFFAKDKPTQSCTLKTVHSKSPVNGHDPKFLFPHWYKTVPSVYNENTFKWSSNAQICSKQELYTFKPSQLHETVQQKCYCKISYVTTFDYYNPEAISQWYDILYYTGNKHIHPTKKLQLLVSPPGPMLIKLFSCSTQLSMKFKSWISLFW